MAFKSLYDIFYYCINKTDTPLLLKCEYGYVHDTCTELGIEATDAEISTIRDYVTRFHQRPPKDEDDYHYRFAQPLMGLELSQVTGNTKIEVELKKLIMRHTAEVLGVIDLNDGTRHIGNGELIPDIMGLMGQYLDIFLSIMRDVSGVSSHNELVDRVIILLRKVMRQ